MNASVQDIQAMIRSKIRNALTEFPYLSRSHLTVSMGPGIPAKLWRPVLEELLENGEIVEDDFHYTDNIGRSHTGRRMRLLSTPPLDSSSNSNSNQVVLRNLS